VVDFGFQDDGIARLEANLRFLLGSEPGLGKSRQLLIPAEPPVLVLAPKMVLSGGTWDDEIAKWRPDLEPGVDIVQVAYSGLTDRYYKQHLDQETGEVLKVTHGPLGRARAEIRDREWGTVICDEAHYLKGRKTKWTEAFHQIDARVERIWAATGTPIPNWAHELFELAKVLDPAANARGERLGSYWRWVADYFENHPTRFSGGKPVVGAFLDDTPEGWLRFYEDNLGDQYLAHTWEQVAPEMPPMGQQTVECPMTALQTKAYKDLKKQYLAFVEETGTEVLAWSAGGLHEKLKQVSTGLQLVDSAFPPDSITASGKINQVRTHLADRPQQTFVVAHYREAVETLHRVAQQVGRTSAFVHGGVAEGTRRSAVRAFQDGSLQTLVGSIETMAEGLNFEDCHLVYRVERAWRPSRNLQVERRVRRISEASPKLVIDFVTPGLDAGMLPVLQAKTDQQMKALKARELAALL
jgi:SNF2 family DNA or RNA helicase